MADHPLTPKVSIRKQWILALALLAFTGGWLIAAATSGGHPLPGGINGGGPGGGR